MNDNDDILKSIITNFDDFENINGIWCHKNQSNQIFYYPKTGFKTTSELEQNSYWFKHRRDVIVLLLKKFSNNNTFFDFGGGTGFLTQYLNAEGFNSFLIEQGIEGVNIAKQRGLDNIICSGIEELDFKNNSVPNIGLFDVAEHIEKDTEFFKKIADIIAFNGFLFITVPAYNFLWSNNDVQAMHFRRYTLRKLKGKLEKVGFSIVYSTYLFSFLLIPIFLFRTIPSIFSKKNNKNNNNEKIIQNQEKEHNPPSKIMLKILNLCKSREFNLIKNGKKIHTGSSCLIIAKLKE